MNESLALQLLRPLRQSSNNRDTGSSFLQTKRSCQSGSPHFTKPRRCPRRNRRGHFLLEDIVSSGGNGLLARFGELAPKHLCRQDRSCTFGKRRFACLPLNFKTIDAHPRQRSLVRWHCSATTRRETTEQRPSDTPVNRDGWLYPWFRRRPRTARKTDHPQAA